VARQQHQQAMHSQAGQQLMMMTICTAKHVQGLLLKPCV
jgi:hypothetical protein